MRKTIFGVSALCAAVILGTVSGCGASGEEKVTVVGMEAESEASEPEGSGETSALAPELTEPEEEVVSEPAEISRAEEADEEMVLPFAGQEQINFVFSSGAGAWATELSVFEDGSFEGLYHDADMGDTGEDYPNGVVYVCSFSGKFDQTAQVDEYTYLLQVEELELEETPGTESIEDGIRYIYSQPYGMTEDGEMYLYLPGIALEALPEEYRSWVNMAIYDSNASTLPFYGLYNPEGEYGFFSNEAEPQVSDIEEELAGIAARAQELEDKINNDPLSQYELNQAAAELYALWDDELNVIWARLKETLDESTMAELTAEEKEWIADKDAQVAAAGAEFEGGSMQPMVEAAKAAELTKDRVYELAEYLK